MAEESTARDHIQRTREMWEARSRGEFPLEMDEYAPDAVLDTAGYGMGTFEGREAIRGFITDWIGAFEDLTMEAEEIIDLGKGVMLIVYNQKGRPPGASNYVRVRSAILGLWVDGMIVRSTIYTETEIDEARAAAERLAQERG
jgi:ketosteroid isomerase-like protein